MIIKLTAKERKMCEKFADERYGEDQSTYKKRGGFKREDILTGAMAEVAVCNALRDAGLKVTDPDFTIHAKGKKSFDADLTDGNYSFHVKGQSMSSAKKYGDSWLLQRFDPILSDPPRKHYMVPTTVDMTENQVEIHAIVPLVTIVNQGCVGECALTWFRKTKVAIYLKDIKRLQKHQRWRFICEC